mmetsp:Transcript_22571/g.58850  ORF Transcript_22571/g.58850 Transcript_22571/m.58850 type:complete len:329 (-) Transcript_22571:1091-2077(-)
MRHVDTGELADGGVAVGVVHHLVELAGGQPLAEQVLVLLVVDLHHAGLHREAPALRLQVRAAAEDLLHGARDHPWMQRITQHSERLARAGLPISKDAHLLAIQGRLHQLANLSKHVVLRGLGPEYAVKGKHVQGALLPLGARHDQLHAAARRRLLVQNGLHGRRTAVQLLHLHGRRRAEAAEHADVALHLLDGVVQLAAVVLVRVQLAAGALKLALQGSHFLFQLRLGVGQVGELPARLRALTLNALQLAAYALNCDRLQRCLLLQLLLGDRHGLQVACGLPGGAVVLLHLDGQLRQLGHQRVALPCDLREVCPQAGAVLLHCRLGLL